MAITKYQFLDEVGIQNLAQELLGKVNVRISERIVNELNASSDDDHVLSAQKLFEILGGDGEESIATQIAGLKTGLTTLDGKVDGLTHLSIELVVGDLNTEVTEPSTSVMYFHKDSDDDKTWDIYIYRAVNDTPTWIVVGDTSVDLVDYWKKTDTEAMREALNIHDIEALPAATITAKVQAAFEATNPFTPTEPAE